MNPKLLLSLAAGLALVAACAKKPATDGATAPESSAKADESSAPESEPAPSASAESKAPPKELTGCEKIMADFDKALGEASYACKKDSDCKCFETGLSKSPGSECGGVVDAEAAKKLDPLAKQAKKDSCATMAQCEPWSCEPICENSRCQKGPHEKKKKK